ATTYGWDRPVEDVTIPLPVGQTDDAAFGPDGTANLTMTLPSELPGDPNYDYKFMLNLYATDRDGNVANLSKSFLDMVSEVAAQARMTAVLSTPTEPAKLQVR